MTQKGSNYPVANDDSSSDDSLIVYYRSASSQSAIGISDTMKHSPGKKKKLTQQSLDKNNLVSSSRFSSAIEDRTGSTSHTTLTPPITTTSLSHVTATKTTKATTSREEGE